MSKRVAAGVAWAVAAALAHATAADAAPPELRTFDDLEEDDGVSAYDPSPVITAVGGECGASIQLDPVATAPGDLAAFGSCPTYRIRFPGGQAHVSLRAWAANPALRALALAPAAFTIEGTGDDGTRVSQTIADAADATWIPLTVRTPDGRATIDEVTLTGDSAELGLDDLLFATTPQPDTTIGGTPAAFSLAASVPGSTFECSLDDAPFAACSAAPAYGSLAAGSHTLRARARDPYGNLDTTPAERTWTVVPPPGSGGDADGDGVPASRDNCPDQPNRSQADEDIDDIGNTCELLPSGTIIPVAGLRTRVRTLSGTVLIKLPRESALAGAAQLPPGFVPLKGSRRTSVDTPQEAGYIPLEGVATVPVGSTIDARKGRVAVTAATTYGRRSVTRTGRFAAAIFTIKQARRRAESDRRRPPTDLVLRTPPGLTRACAAAATTPPKGIVRALTGSVLGPRKGRFRAVGAASVTTVQRGTWVTQDRCDGTLTEVGRGRATVRDRGRQRTVSVRPGNAYLARARLFSAKRRRADA